MVQSQGGKALEEARAEVKEARAELAEVKEELKEEKTARQRRIEAARQVEKELAARVLTVMSTALAVVAGLFWQTAISDTIKAFIPISGAWQYELAIAFMVTVLAAAAIYVLSKSTDGVKAGV